ncbi:MAG: SPOR domain-containing protein [Gammaproteobacteria bacterium]
MAKQARRKGARKGTGGSPLVWFAAGLVIGLGTAVLLYSRGFIPTMPERPEPVAERPSEPEAGLLDDENGSDARSFDFFTVLPEMEVVVPERELSSQSEPAAAPSPDSGGESFMLQAGSFRSAADADQMKARLALLGAVADVQQVTVNDQTWHRVRIGPVNGAREANQLRRQLQDNGIEVLVLRESG